MGSYYLVQSLLVWFCLSQIWRESACVLEENGGDLVVGLKHRGFGNMKVMNSFELLRVSSERSSSRFHSLRRNRHGHKKHSMDFSLPLRAGSDYIMPLMLGTSPQRLEVFMDTGSDLVWVPCSANSSKPSFECIMCEDLDIPTFSAFQSNSSRPAVCSSDSCSAIHNSDNPRDLCTMAGCSFESIDMDPCQAPCPAFYYAYGDGSLRGELIRDRLSVHLAKGGAKKITNFTFGCAGISLSEPIGVAGFGRGVLAFHDQLGEVGNKGFSYCLVSHRFDDNLHVSSPLLFGKSAIPKHGKVHYTPMMNNFKYPYFYYLGIEGISIGGQKLELPPSLTRFDKEGNGGLIIDSGTTFTMLPASLHRKVLDKLKSTVKYTRSVEYETASGLDLCYELPTAEGSSPVLPTFSLHFKNNATITLPAENYMFMMSDPSDATRTSTGTAAAAVGCLIILSSGDEVHGPVAVLGNYQQQNLHVVYDVEKERVGFQPKTCSPTTK